MLINILIIRKFFYEKRGLNLFNKVILVIIREDIDVMIIIKKGGGEYIFCFKGLIEILIF